MKKILFALLALTYPLSAYMLDITPDMLGFNRDGTPQANGVILNAGDRSLIDMLSLVQEILLKVGLPVIVVGSALYIAYQLVTAEGDETRMKQAWRSLAYSAIALVVVALSYAMVSIFTNISI